MANEIFRREGKKGYNSDEVDAFLNELNAKRRIFAEEKESEIKRLTSEKEQLSEQLIEENKQNQALVDRLREQEKNFEDERDEINARIGEKISAADEAAKSIKNKTELECRTLKEKTEADCQLMKEKMALQIKAEIAAVREKAEKYCENARKIAYIYEEKQQLIASGIEQARRHLDEAISKVNDAAINSEINEK